MGWWPRASGVQFFSWAWHRLGSVGHLPGAQSDGIVGANAIACSLVWLARDYACLLTDAVDWDCLTAMETLELTPAQVVDYGIEHGMVSIQKDESNLPRAMDFIRQYRQHLVDSLFESSLVEIGLLGHLDRYWLEGQGMTWPRIETFEKRYGIWHWDPAVESDRAMLVHDETQRFLRMPRQSRHEEFGNWRSKEVMGMQFADDYLDHHGRAYDWAFDGFECWLDG